WGDNSTNSFGIVTSHTYAAAGNYNICLTVTLTCGTVGTYCNSQFLSKSTGESADFVFVNTLTADMLETGIKVCRVENLELKISANPNGGEFNVNLSGVNASSAKIEVYNIAGKLVFETNNNSRNGALTNPIKLENPAN